MIAVDEARARILGGLAPVGPETVALAAGFGRVLAADVVARLTQPPADVSAMDGFAIRAADGLVDATLAVVGTAPAGHPFTGNVGPGQAVRVFTGSVMPGGADCVLLQEDAEYDEARVTVREAGEPGRHIRRAGQDFAAGTVLLPAGRRLTPRDIGLAAAGNHPWLTVHRRPRVAILATGDEISLPGEPIATGGVVSSNAHAIAAFVAAAGGEATVLPIAVDDVAATRLAVRAAAGMDLLVTTGGASVGDHDLVQAALGAEGMVLDFWKIAMRPGKPLMFGRLGGLPVLGLPGNPVSAFVCALLFLQPAVTKLAGLPGVAPPTVPAVLGAALKPNDVREDYVRARFDAAGRVVPFGRQDSGMLQALAAAEALIVRPPHDPARSVGETVKILRLDVFGA